MGGTTSCFASIDDIKLESPIAKCFMKHCSSSCMKEAEDIEKVMEEVIREVEAAVKAADIAEVEEARIAADIALAKEALREADPQKVAPK